MENLDSHGAESVRRRYAGMKWRTHSQDKLPDTPGSLVTIAEYDDDGHLPGTAISVSYLGQWEEGQVGEEEAVASILASLLARIGEYLGYRMPELNH
jgi:hypothetical protein